MAVVQLDLSVMLDKLSGHIMADAEETRIGALRWILILHSKIGEHLASLQDRCGLIDALLVSVSDKSDRVVLLGLETLSEISSSAQDASYTDARLVRRLSTRRLLALCS